MKIFTCSSTSIWTASHRVSCRCGHAPSLGLGHALLDHGRARVDPGHALVPDCAIGPALDLGVCPGRVDPGHGLDHGHGPSCDPGRDVGRGPAHGRGLCAALALCRAPSRALPPRPCPTATTTNPLELRAWREVFTNARRALLEGAVSTREQCVAYAQAQKQVFLCR